MQKNKTPLQQGFTVIELLVVMGIIAVLASIVLIALNPARHFAQARNTQRTSNISALLNAIGQNIADNKGMFTCSTAPALPSTATNIKSTGGWNGVECLVPTYIPAFPTDPSASGAHFTDNSDYDTGYQVWQDPATGRITVSAPAAELGATISITR